MAAALSIIILSLAAGAAGQAQDKKPLAALCQHVPDGLRARAVAFDESLSEARGLKALQELRGQAADRSGKYVFQGRRVRRLLAQVEGWLLKKQWSDALASRRHDADEAEAYCGFLVGHLPAD